MGTSNNKTHLQSLPEASEPEDPKISEINSNIDSLESKLKELRQSREMEAKKMLDRQKKLNKTLSEIRSHQRNKKKISEEDIEEDVSEGIDARLNMVTRKNLRLKEENDELNAVIVQKNSHIAKIMKKMRELQAENERLEAANKELTMLVDQGDLGAKKQLQGGNGSRRVVGGRVLDGEDRIAPISNRVKKPKFSKFLTFIAKSQRRPNLQ